MSRRDNTKTAQGKETSVTYFVTDVSLLQEADMKIFEKRLVLLL